MNRIVYDKSRTPWINKKIPINLPNQLRSIRIPVTMKSRIIIRIYVSHVRCLYKLYNERKELRKEWGRGGERKSGKHLGEFFFAHPGTGTHPPFETLHTRKSLKTGRDSSFAHYRAILRERSRGMIGEQRVSVFSRTLRPKCLTLASAQKGGEGGGRALDR